MHLMKPWRKFTICQEAHQIDNESAFANIFNMIQIIGLKSCNDTKKAVRYLKERRVEYQFVDLGQHTLSAGELENIFQHLDPVQCINVNSPYYRRKGMQYMEFDAREELSQHNELFITPILRCRGKAALGYDVDFLEANS